MLHCDAAGERRTHAYTLLCTIIRPHVTVRAPRSSSLKKKNETKNRIKIADLFGRHDRTSGRMLITGDRYNINRPSACALYYVLGRYSETRTAFARRRYRVRT